MSIIIFAIVIVSLAAFGAWKDGRDTEGTYEKPKKITSEDRNYNKAKYIVEKYAKALAIEPNGFYRKESLLSHDKATIEEAIFHLANLEGNDDFYLKFIQNKLSSIHISLDHFLPDSEAEVLNAIELLQESGIALSQRQIELLKKADQELAERTIKRSEKFTQATRLMS